jgi:hypothetical protein
MEKRMVPQIVRPPQRVRALQQPRAAHGEDELLGQKVGPQARIDAGAEADAHLRLVQREVHQPVRDVDAHVDVGMARAEAVEPRHQPFDRERRRGRDGQHARPAGPADALDRLADQAERFAGRRQQRLARPRQAHRPAGPPEQPDAELLLQRADLVADGRRRHGEFARRLGEAEMARRRLEDAHRAEAGKPSGHAPIFNLNLQIRQQRIVCPQAGRGRYLRQRRSSANIFS